MQKLKLLAKAFLIIFVVVFVVGGLFSGIVPLLLASLLLLGVIVVPAYFLSNVAASFLFRKDHNYQAYKRRGGNVFWDNFLGPLNPTEVFYSLPHPEPEYSDFVPPVTWKFQCLTCYARVESPDGSCWNCGVNLDQDF